MSDGAAGAGAGAFVDAGAGVVTGVTDLDGAVGAVGAACWRVWRRRRSAGVSGRARDFCNARARALCAKLCARSAKFTAS